MFLLKCHFVDEYLVYESPVVLVSNPMPYDFPIKISGAAYNRDPNTVPVSTIKKYSQA